MIVMDYSQIAISNLMADLKGTTNADVNIPLIRHMILNTIRSNRLKFKNEFGEVVIACDANNYWRKDVFPFYKAHRKNDRKNSDYDWEQIYLALNTVKEELKTYFPYPVIEVDKCEADDVIASLVFWSNENECTQQGFSVNPQPLLILSGDHDFVQLQKYPHVSQYSPIQKKWVKADKSIDSILREHVLRGDAGDGIPNFLSVDNSFVDKIRQKSVYEKDMVNWVEQDLSAWKSTQHWPNVERNQKLIDLDCVPKDLQEKIVYKYLEDRNARDRSQLMNYFVQNKMMVMFDHLGEF